MAEWQKSPIVAIVAVVLLAGAGFFIYHSMSQKQSVSSLSKEERGKIFYLCPSCGNLFVVTPSQRQAVMRKRGHAIKCPSCGKAAFKAMKCRQCGAWIVDVVDAGKLKKSMMFTYKCPKCHEKAYLRFSKKAITGK